MPYENACSSPVRPKLSPGCRRWTVELENHLIETQLIRILTFKSLFYILLGLLLSRPEVSLSDITDQIKTFLCGTVLLERQTRFRFC
jgi:hypothetical protein